MENRSLINRIALCLFLLWTVSIKADPEITVAAAASTVGTVEKIGQAFYQKTGVVVNIISGSSGKLTVQILNGAPYDIFMAADMNYPEVLYSKGKATAPPRKFAAGILVLWTKKEIPLESLSVLNSKEVRRIAIPNPELAPFGSEAVKVLRSGHLYDTVKDKLVYGSNVNQTTQYIAHRAADVGFVSLSKVLEYSHDDGTYLKIPESLSESVPHGIVVVKKQGDRSQAEAFYRFIFTKEGRDLLQSDGYLVASENKKS
ncbi:MAG: molybdate ABC transporter substrate-binding protein [Chitinispirillaceae bacterium]